jgi:hypothetical protein
MASKLDLLHFVGSIPLPDGEAVFAALSSSVGDYLRRMPDGETGERLKWIVFQQRMLTAHPAMEVDPDQPPLPVKQSDSTVFREIRRLRMKPNVDPERVDFDTTYDRAALESYKTFSRFKREGRISAPTRFQFALPTPMASGLMYVSPNGRSRYLRAYERALLKALTNILAGIPHDQLSIQFDICQELLLFENYFPERDHDYKEQSFGQFARLAAAVPDDVELGFHLCYGSPNDQPLVRLEDASVLVELMNGIDQFVGRRVAFIHVPVPRHASTSFFAPMKRWRNTKETWPYLGLLQFDDAVGDARRIEAARTVMSDFGIGAECGFGRTNPVRVPTILVRHRAAADFLQHLFARR